METEVIDKIKQAGKIHQQLIAFAKDIVKPGALLLEIATKIDDKIEELGAKPAFPVNLSIDDVAAHWTPAHNSTETAQGLLKVDIGVHIDGFVADGAVTIDCEGSEENKKLIEAAQAGLAAGVETFGKGVMLKDIGKAIADAIQSFDAVPVTNLSGHMIEQYDLHAGVNIPNYDNAQEYELEEGLYAVEPFATNGQGRVKDGKPGNIFVINRAEGNVRDTFAREVLMFIDEEYQGLPFCSRWIYKKFGARGLLALRQIVQSGIIHEYPQLVEANRGKVAQAEHTVLILDNGTKIVTTRD